MSSFIDTNGLRGIDAVGSSKGARLVLELARRGGELSAVVSLDPGGFWQGWQRNFFYGSIYVSIRLVRFLQPVMRQESGAINASVARRMERKRKCSESWSFASAKREGPAETNFMK